MFTYLTKTSLSFSSLHIVNVAHIIKRAIWPDLTAYNNLIFIAVLISYTFTIPYESCAYPHLKSSISNDSFIISIKNFINLSKFVGWVIIYRRQVSIKSNFRNILSWQWIYCHRLGVPAWDPTAGCLNLQQIIIKKVFE